MGRLLSRLFGPLAVAAMISGCALTTGRPSVAELKYNPGRYQHRTVAIDGIVTSSWGVPLMPFNLYKVSDGTGEMTVLAQGGRVPTKGAHVRVKGRVNDMATFGGRSVGLHLEQTDLDHPSEEVEQLLDGQLTGVSTLVFGCRHSGVSKS